VSRLAPWRVAARLARREVRRRPGRTVLVSLLVAVPVLVLLVASALWRTDEARRNVDPFGQAAVRVEAFGEGRQFDAAALAARLPTGVASTHWVDVSIPIRTPSATTADSTWTRIIVSPLDDPLADGVVHVIEGRMPVAAAEGTGGSGAGGEVALSPQLADTFGVEVGDVVTLARPAQEFTVVGLVANPRGTWEELLVAPGFDLAAVRSDYYRFIGLVGERGVDSTGVLLGELGMTSWWSGNGYYVPESGPFRNAFIQTYDDANSADPVEYLLLWLSIAFVLAVVAVVVSAAFAVSGRRQLVGVGQLSAAGTSPSLLRRFLALQGTWSGLLGVGVAVVLAAVGLVLARMPLFGGRVVVRLTDWLVVALTAMVAATLAALLPARSLARMSPLTALGGRHPVRQVRARAVGIGAVLAGGGWAVVLLCLAIASSTDSGGPSDGGMQALALLVMLGLLAVLVGTVLLAPMAVAALARLTGRLAGAGRLAVRELDRHRARSGALVAAIIVVGAAAFAVGSGVEQELRNREQWTNDWSLTSIGLAAANEGALVPKDPDVLAPGKRAEVEAVVGPVEWVKTVNVDLVLPAVGGVQAVVPPIGQVAIAETLESYGWDEATVARMMEAPVTIVDRNGVPTPQWAVDALAESLGVAPADVLVVEEERLLEGDEYMPDGGWIGPQSTVYVAQSLVDADEVAVAWIDVRGTTDHPLSQDEIDRLNALNDPQGAATESAYFVDAGEVVSSGVYVSAPWIASPWPEWVRLALIGGMLAFVTVVVALGLALWAAEGRDERSTLLTLGAGPSTVARVTAWKAWLLATLGGVLAVVLGWAGMRSASAAVDARFVMPWWMALAVVLVVPAVVAAGSAGASLIGQHRQMRLVRPGQLD
jgi:putative ABC transport system permease protein